MNKWKRYLNKTVLLILVGIIVLVSGSAFVLANSQQADAEEDQYRTTTVKKGDLSVSISGQGTLEPSETRDLAFGSIGTVASISVNVGDKVTAGQELARLEDIADLEVNVTSKELELQALQDQLDDLLNGKDVALAQARVDLAAAEKTFSAAKTGLLKYDEGRCDSALTEEYMYEYLYDKKDVEDWYALEHTVGEQYFLEKLRPLQEKMNQAYNNWQYCYKYTDVEVDVSKATYYTAQADLDQKQAYYNTLLESSGLDESQVKLLEAQVKNAELQLEMAKQEVEGAVITAPIDGTVILINGEVGEDVGTSTFIQIADLTTPIIDTTVDETDLQEFAVGCPAEVVFDALPTRKFDGTVTNVYPLLVDVDGYSMVEGEVELNSNKFTSERTLPIGLNASVDITCKSVTDVLYVLLDAVHTNEDGSAYVYVLTGDNQYEKRTVETGLQTLAFSEIKSGLAEGEEVLLDDPTQITPES
jgi:RND family efflux transporter MFP subunit